MSLAIRTGTASPYSHASIYFRDGVILEANDDGVGPRRIRPLAMSETGGLAGLPYDNWSSIVVLRGPKDYTPQDWERAMLAALDEHVGLDFPPLSVMARGASPGLALLVVPFAAALDFFDWLRNREPMAYDSWCSRLVGHVLSEQFVQRLSVRQRLTLGRASPQRLFELAKELGYAQVQDCVCRAAPVPHRAFEDARNDFARIQDETYGMWRARSEERRENVRREKSFQLLRLISKRLGAFFVIVLIGLIAAGWYVTRDTPAGAAADKAADIRVRIAEHESEIHAANQEIQEISAKQQYALQFNENRWKLINRIQEEINKLDQRTAQGKREAERHRRNIEQIQNDDGGISYEELNELAQRKGRLTAKVDRNQREIDALNEALALLMAETQQ